MGEAQLSIGIYIVFKSSRKLHVSTVFQWVSSLSECSCQIVCLYLKEEGKHVLSCWSYIRDTFSIWGETARISLRRVLWFIYDVRLCVFLCCFSCLRPERFQTKSVNLNEVCRLGVGV